MSSCARPPRSPTFSAARRSCCSSLSGTLQRRLVGGDRGPRRRDGRHPPADRRARKPDHQRGKPGPSVRMDPAPPVGYLVQSGTSGFPPPGRQMAGRAIQFVRTMDSARGVVGAGTESSWTSALPMSFRSFARNGGTWPQYPRAPNIYAKRLAIIRGADSASVRKAALAQHGIEESDPFSDRRLIEFAFRIPPDQLYWDGVQRPLMRDALADRLPASLFRSLDAACNPPIGRSGSARPTPSPCSRKFRPVALLRIFSTSTACGERSNAGRRAIGTRLRSRRNFGLPCLTRLVSECSPRPMTDAAGSPLAAGSCALDSLARDEASVSTALRVPPDPIGGSPGTPAFRGRAGPRIPNAPFGRSSWPDIRRGRYSRRPHPRLQSRAAARWKIRVPVEQIDCGQRHLRPGSGSGIHRHVEFFMLVVEKRTVEPMGDRGPSAPALRPIGGAAAGPALREDGRPHRS